MNKLKKCHNISIINDEYVIKKEHDLSDLEKYLRSRSYDGFIQIINRDLEGNNHYPYIENFSLDNNQLGLDIIDNIALLHNKTSYKKEVGKSKNKEIYDNLNGYIKYLSDYFKDLLIKYEYIEFPSPSNILFMSNYTKLNDSLVFCKEELDKWYKLVKDNDSKRVSLIHGNIKLDHAIYNDRLYLCSWSKARFDTPIIDFIEFYHSDWYKLEFSSLLEEYLKKCELLDDEKKLLFINLVIPSIPVLKDDEFNNVLKINMLYDYIYKTEKLIRPYYSKDDKEK